MENKKDVSQLRFKQGKPSTHTKPYPKSNNVLKPNVTQRNTTLHNVSASKFDYRKIEVRLLAQLDQMATETYKKPFKHLFPHEQKRLYDQLNEKVVMKPRSLGVASLVKSLKHKEPKPVLSHKQHRIRRKMFRRTKQVPHGMVLRYSSVLRIDPNPQPTAHMKRQEEELNKHAQELFKKNYFNLSSSQQSRVWEALHSKSESAVAGK